MSILFVILCSCLAGIDNWVGMEDYCRTNFAFFCKYFDLSSGVPSHDTLARVMRLIHPERFLECFCEFTHLLSKQLRGVVAIDGKTARKSNSLDQSKNPLHLVSAWSSAHHLVLAQVKTADKSNEIKAIPKLLEMLDLSGEVVTIDAMGCQREIAEKILEKDADYVLSLKGNQRSLHKDLQYLFQGFEEKSWEDFIGTRYESCEKDHSRIVTRKVWATECLGDLTQQHQWPGLRSAILLESTREIKGKKTTERRLYISSLPPDAERAYRCIRSHWGIENQLHWVLDTTFNEDRSQISKDHSPENMSLARKWALNILRAVQGKKSLKRTQNYFYMNGNNLEEVFCKEI